MTKPEYYEDAAGKWRWRLTADNGEIFGASHQGFDSKGNAMRNFLLHKKAHWSEPVVKA